MVLDLVLTKFNIEPSVKSLQDYLGGRGIILAIIGIILSVLFFFLARELQESIFSYKCAQHGVEPTPTLAL